MAWCPETMQGGIAVEKFLLVIFIIAILATW